eukprot:TRINITY_DN20451_c0_g1_i1.p1 TRINITY_DN20451_c0_g1~~TRINITY_DN20451_c0_g1_i1.p1  ORF type:complete len:723 (-),score=191.97 TRINITY_DN20451_c0_g1_i1:506-2674(-)
MTAVQSGRTALWRQLGLRGSRCLPPCWYGVRAATAVRLSREWGELQLQSSGFEGQQKRGFAMRLPKSAFYRDVPEDAKPIPLAIVGRPNVGKSTLFNRLLAGTKRRANPIQRKALVSPRAGTTRDRKDATAVLGGLVLRLIDTGGLELQDPVHENSLLTAIEQQVWKAIAEAEAVLFLIDAREGITPVDIHIAKMLKDQKQLQMMRQRLGQPVGKEVPIILVANKAEGSYIGEYLNDCYELDVGDPVIVSATENEGMDSLYDRLCLEVGHLQKEPEESDDSEFEFSEDEADVPDNAELEGSIDVAERQAGEGFGAEGEDKPAPTLKWLASENLTDEQKLGLKWFAEHPSDPVGVLDEGLRKSVLHKMDNALPNYLLSMPKKALPGKEARDFALGFRRMEEMEKPMKLSVIGMPSTGKSSIINALLQEERVIVDPVQGTTMDSIVNEWSFRDQPIKLIDTCGVYRGFKFPGVKSGDVLEPGMGTRKAIRRSHVAVLCCDPTQKPTGAYVAPGKWEVRLGNYIVDEGKALVIAINKWDLVPEADQKRIRDEILDRVADKFANVKGIPVIFMSAKYNMNLPMLMTRTLALYKRWSARLPTGKLNAWLQAWMLRWPPPWKDGIKCNVKYITQTRTRPPTFVLWTNVTAGRMPNNYMKQLTNAMRNEFRISGVPLKLIIRSTMMPKPHRKLKRTDRLKWKRMGPKQAEAVMKKNLNARGMRRIRQTD